MKGLRDVLHARVQLQGGFWGSRQQTHHEVTVPHALNCLEADGHVTNFDLAAGTFHGPTASGIGSAWTTSLITAMLLRSCGTEPARSTPAERAFRSLPTAGRSHNATRSVGLLPVWCLPGRHFESTRQGMGGLVAIRFSSLESSVCAQRFVLCCIPLTGGMAMSCRFSKRAGPIAVIGYPQT